MSVTVFDFGLLAICVLGFEVCWSFGLFVSLVCCFLVCDFAALFGVFVAFSFDLIV